MMMRRRGVMADHDKVLRGPGLTSRTRTGAGRYDDKDLKEDSQTIGADEWE